MTLIPKNKHHIEFKSQHKSLSILFNSGGFSFSILDTPTQKVISFTKYLFEKSITTPEILLSEILRIFASEKELQQDFENILIIHQNQLSCLVPSSYFDEHKLKTYLDYNIKTLPTDYITYDNLETIDAKNVYVPYVNINNYFFQNFGEFEFKHHSTILIDKLLNYSKLHLDQLLFVYVSEKQLDIVVTKTEKLILYNSFTFETEQDFIYHILFVAEQLEMNTDSLNLKFLGSIKEEDETYKTTYKYIRNIDFITTNTDFFLNSDIFLTHSNYILVS